MTDGWHDFFVATAGAAAALAGLIIVAISVNIEAIIKIRGMTSRAGATVAVLVLSLVGSVVLLMPASSPAIPGAAILPVAIIAAVIVARSGYEVFLAERGHRPVLSTLSKVALGAAQALPFVVGALLLLAGDGAGIAWVAAGVVLVFIGSVTNAWVLLVEILR